MQIESSIERYLQQIATTDRQDTGTSKYTHVRLKNKIKKLEQEIDYLNQVNQALPEAPDN